MRFTLFFNPFKYKIPVVIGGYNLRIYPRESVSHPEIDFGVSQQALYTIPALFSELEGKRNFEQVPGLVYKEGKEVKITPYNPKEIDFNDFPNPARHLLPNELYAEFPTERKNFTVMVTSLGCPYSCNFCEAGKTSYNPRLPEKVVEEMQQCYFKYGIREIDIFDYEFTAIRERVSKICKLIQEKKIDVAWACRSRVDTVDAKLLEEMKRAGCRRIYFGLESGVQRILNDTNKGITLKQIRNTIGACRDLNIKTLGFFLIGALGETRETIQESLEFAKELNLEYIQFSKLLAKPGTSLWRDMVRDTGIDYWKEWILGREIDRPLPRVWTKLSNQEIDYLARTLYIQYHSRPAFLIRSILQVRSL